MALLSLLAFSLSANCYQISFFFFFGQCPLLKIALQLTQFKLGLFAGSGVGTSQSLGYSLVPRGLSVAILLPESVC